MITLPQHGSQDLVRKSRCAATGQPAGEIDGFVDGRVRRRLENQQFVEADPQHLPNRFFEFLRVTFEEMVDQKVEAALPARDARYELSSRAAGSRSEDGRGLGPDGVGALPPDQIQR